MLAIRNSTITYLAPVLCGTRAASRRRRPRAAVAPRNSFVLRCYPTGGSGAMCDDLHRWIGRQRGIEPVVNLRGIETGDGPVGKQPGEQIGPRLGKLVERHPTAREFGLDREHPSAGRGFENDFGGTDRRRDGRDESEPRRRRKLLERL